MEVSTAGVQLEWGHCVQNNIFRSFSFKESEKRAYSCRCSIQNHCLVPVMSLPNPCCDVSNCFRIKKTKRQKETAISTKMQSKVLGESGAAARHLRVETFQQSGETKTLADRGWPSRLWCCQGALAHMVPDSLWVQRHQPQPSSLAMYTGDGELYHQATNSDRPRDTGDQTRKTRARLGGREVAFAATSS